jgi:hypothetical protein
MEKIFREAERKRGGQFSPLCGAKKRKNQLIKNV